MSIIRKSFSAITKAVDEAEGIVEAIVNVGAVLDAQDDVMLPGCWANVTKAAGAGEVDWPSICWGHDWKDIRGKVLSAEERDSKLHIVGQYAMETQAGREAFALVKGGYVKQWSVGFEPDPDAVKFEKGVRYIGNVKRWPEVSNVLLGASPGTTTTATKADEPEEEPVFSDRQVRSAQRLKAGLELLEMTKADECTEEARSEDDGKEDDSVVVEKDEQMPDLQGDEAQHMGPLKTACNAIKELIAQELAEDEPEPDCVMRLACIWQDLLSWAAGEAQEYTDYGSLPMLMRDYFRAGIAKLAEPVAEPVEEPAVEEPEELPDWLRNAMESFTATDPETPAAAPESPQHSVSENSDEGLQLPHAMRHRHGRYASYMESFGPQ